ncbi:COX15/CtaA family protein [Litoribacter populi]|uniref:COX15/CtaA family protein n=1 Tax=Litoribacter populi TaxID=2598460 RepID=UPI00117C3C39|nr:COX15/CtaA family protein [Litoribacter populi]
MHTSFQKSIYLWLISGALLVTMMVVVGGITRLTQSGLSMVKWEPITGAIPPLTEEAWQVEFEAYQQSPEFEFFNTHFELSDFKKIFFWEYFHRLLGRIVGLVFLVPCIYFWAKRAFSSKLKKQVIIIFLGGLFQGVLGWYMVKSGLVDKPYVSHYRLAAHLLTALALVGYIYWVAMEVKGVKKKPNALLNKLGWSMLVLMSVQILYGAFVAGLKAGLMYNTFPKMGQNWVPAELSYGVDMFGWGGLFESHGIVQLVHRILGMTVLILSFIILLNGVKSDGYLRKVSFYQGLAVFVQFGLGIWTLLAAVPIELGVLHQVGAVGVLLSVIYLVFVTKKQTEQSICSIDTRNRYVANL